MPDDPWQISEAAYPRSSGNRERLRFLIGYALLAPSSHNTQPWRFRLIDDGVELHADRSRLLHVADPEGRELTISCGAALFHLRLALRHFGLGVNVELLPDARQPDFMARVRIDGAVEPPPEETVLFHAITKRRTYRLEYDERKPNTELVGELADAAERQGAWLQPVGGLIKREAVAELVAEGTRRQASDPAFRRELASWIRPNHSTRRDGVFGYTMGMGGIASWIGPWFIRTANWGERQSKTDRDAALHAPMLAVLGTDDDTPLAWLHAGEALARVLLRATAAGLHASYLNQPTQEPELRSNLATAIERQGLPQILLRLGYPRLLTQPSPRRDIDEFLDA